MPKFRKKPIVIEAVQFDGKPLIGVLRDSLGQAYVVTIHQQRCYIKPGDWIITEPDGIHYYPCKPDIFAMTYEEVIGG